MKVSHQFAECISLPNHTTVQVRAASNLAKATLVTIEPDTEDDWEILELNSEHAEAAILKQVINFSYNHNETNELLMNFIETKLKTFYSASNGF